MTLNSAQAETAGTEVDIETLRIPTLTQMHDEGIQMPNGEIYPSSGYTLTQITPSDPGNLPPNTIVKYLKNETDNTIVPVYFTVTLKNKEYGDISDKTNPMYFKWKKDVNGNNSFVPATNVDKDITYYLKTSGATVTNSKDAGTLINPPNISYGNNQKLIGGASVSNTAGSTITINNTLYKDNVTTGKLLINKGNYFSADILGGAVYNDGEITGISADFVNNSVTGLIEDTNYGAYMYSYGGAIANNGEIGDINGNFVGNFAKIEYLGNFDDDFGSINGYAYGGAIYNYDGTIGNINGDFVNNYAFALGEKAYGGAIYNEKGQIGNITGNFIGNSALSPRVSSSKAYGGAIYNESDGIIGDLRGDFVGNYAAGENSDGGAIYNAGKIGNITGNFIGNYLSNDPDNRSNVVQGGAISNYGEIGNITGDFVGNYIYGISAKGGAIYNYDKIGNITGDFIGNYIMSKDSLGGAIYNSGWDAKIGNIKGNFIKNHVFGGLAGTSEGGAIYNSDNIGSISGSFLMNSVKGTWSRGGAISNSGDIEKISGNFIQNSIESEGYYDSYFNLYGIAEGGAVFNEGNIKEITGDFIENRAVSSIAAAHGGAIYNNSDEITEIKNSSFINNHASTNSDTETAKGGAIYSATSIKIIAENSGKSIISGNYTLTNGVKDDNAIYMGTSLSDKYNDELGKTVYTISNPELTLNANTHGVIIINDKITGEQGGGSYYEEYNSTTDTYDKIYLTHDKNYKLHITGDSTGLVQINNNVEAVTGEADIDLTGTTLHLAKSDTVLNGNNLALNSGSLSMINNRAGTMALKDFTLNGNTNFAADVNLANKTMDRITADTYTVNTAATLNVNYLHLLNDAESYETRILFADADLANNVAYTGLTPIAYSPIYKYQVDCLKETGEFLFTRGGGGAGGNPSDNFNPSVLPTPVNNQAGGYTTQLQTFNYAFQHSDTFMQIPAAQRFAIKNQNRYALSPTGDATDVGVFSPLLTKYETGGIWFKPYASFENIPLKNGPKVNNINYGTLVGFDSNLKSIKHGWERVLTGYIGYNGATQNFSGVTSNQNGGILGTTATFYKGNFFNATTLSVGATAGSNNTMYGSEDYTMLLAGIADKFGYNFEFKEGKYIIQPSMLMSYSFVNTFDYRNAAGVNIQSDPLNALQLAPGIKFIMNTKNGWQPYIGVNMVWNIMDQTKVKANDVRLPSMSIDPYIEYGVGVQRKWGERFMGYAQAMVHNGGRNGISLNGGFRWAIGKK